MDVDGGFWGFCFVGWDCGGCWRVGSGLDERGWDGGGGKGWLLKGEGESREVALRRRFRYIWGVVGKVGRRGLAFLLSLSSHRWLLVVKARGGFWDQKP